MNTTIATLLEHKGRSVFQVADSVTVEQAVHAMNQNKVGSVLVMHGDKLAGIFTERDVLRRIVGEGRDPQLTPITAVMTAAVLTIDPEATVQQVMDLFTEKRCRHLPVVKEDRVVGVISIGDVSRWVAGQHRLEAESLRHYINGGLPG